MIRSSACAALLAAAIAPPPASTADARVEIALDTSEAEAALAILSSKAGGQPATDGDWQRLFTSEPYVRLKKREAAIGRWLSDEEFRRFTQSDDLVRTPDSWSERSVPGARPTSWPARRGPSPT